MTPERLLEDGVQARGLRRLGRQEGPPGLRAWLGAAAPGGFTLPPPLRQPWVRDLLAHFAALILDAFQGRFPFVRDRSARALPFWPKSM